MAIGQNIKKYRKEKGLTQKSLGDIINKKEITVRKYESNDISPSIEILKEISAALGVTINELLGNKTEIQNIIDNLLSNGLTLEQLSKNTDIPLDELKNMHKNSGYYNPSYIDNLGQYINAPDEKILRWIEDELRLRELKNNDKTKQNLEDTKIIKDLFKDVKFEDVISNDRDRLLFSFKCLLTNYAIDWSAFTDSELIEIINSGTMFDFFHKITKTYHNFFKNRSDVSNIKIDPPKEK